VTTDENQGLMARIIAVFLNGNLAAMLIILSLLGGAAALFVTPREEDPQIVVPLADVIIQVPGHSAPQIERQIATRLEKMLYQIDGVEYVYSMSRDDTATVTVRFYVGEDREASLIKLHNKIAMNIDDVPAAVTGWVIKPIEIDDVPIVNITLHSDRYSDVDLRRIAEELEIRLQAVPDTGRTYVVGGRPRVLHVWLDAERMAGRGLSYAAVEWALRGANVTLPAGGLQRLDEQIDIDAGAAFASADQVAELMIGVADGLPVYLRDVAKVELGAAEPRTYTRFAAAPDGEPHAAVTVAIAKRKGANAVWVSRDVQAEMRRLAPALLPDGVEWQVTRDYGKTANDKVNELVEGLVVAVIIVVGLLALVMGWREGLVVATAVPITFSLTLLINYLTGYTINRVTLFALILALGLVVDDPIVDVENIHRHFKMRKQKPLDAVLTAVNEVRPPIILATLAVIISFVPLFFITGMMGPYMAPMALNVPLAMLMSMVVAFTITPWLSYHLLKHDGGADDKDDYDLHRTPIYRVYSSVMRPLLDRRLAQWCLITVVLALFGLSGWLVMTRRVPLKMLPFDNKNEFQVVVDMPEGTTLERTAAATDALARYLLTQSEVRDVSTFVGTASPMDFNGMVRHYYLRSGANVADIRINLMDKDHRQQQSHGIALRVRNDLRTIAQRYDANIKIVELPPGPPVISTITVEVYGRPFDDYARLQQAARRIEARLRDEPGVVDVDTSIEAQQRRYLFVTDKEKAALAGLTTADVAQLITAALDGRDVTMLRDDNDVNPTPIRIRLPLADRSSIAKLENLYIATSGGGGGSGGGDSGGGVMVQLGEIGSFVETTVNQMIYHKNLRQVVYVFADTAGRPPATAILDTQGDVTLPEGIEAVWSGEGEWKITLDVFRDLGLAFGAACIGIYLLLVIETGSYFLPVVLMISIPLTIIGIMPGFWLLNLISDVPIDGWDNPVFFTATAMIGMIALSGIAVRNAILLIDFIHHGQREGKPMRQAILESGAVRLTPIFLTASTAMLAAIPITLDPIFSGLAWALIFGLLVSTSFTLVLIPMIYWMIYRPRTDA
jgi:multidrug efflux pump subunit AcrB